MKKQDFTDFLKILQSFNPEVASELKKLNDSFTDSERDIAMERIQPLWEELQSVTAELAELYKEGNALILKIKHEYVPKIRKIEEGREHEQDLAAIDQIVQS